ncbi:hypothetical protein T07_6287 [Trichinella nelsoni]|uniref:Uncharacterized protein n=1 Tax=Trichinella nelsoni TaxID=6336 RepID=A0A0V0S6I0_9BILA|nr:hypothetical protein T07_6287 [Trichinella nelsoni]
MLCVIAFDPEFFTFTLLYTESTPTEISISQLPPIALLVSNIFAFSKISGVGVNTDCDWLMKPIACIFIATSSLKKVSGISGLTGTATFISQTLFLFNKSVKYFNNIMIAGSSTINMLCDDAVTTWPNLY